MRNGRTGDSYGIFRRPDRDDPGIGRSAGTRVAHYSRIAFDDGICYVEISAGYGQNAAWDLWHYVLSYLFAGRYTGKRGARRKFLWGMCSGMLYFGILAAVSVLSKRTVQPDALHRVLAFVFCAAGGMLGGMTA